MTPLQIEILRLYVEQMQPMPIRRSHCINLDSSHVLQILFENDILQHTHFHSVYKGYSWTTTSST